MKRKILTLFLSAMILTSSLTGCGAEQESVGSNNSEAVAEVTKAIELVPTQEILEADISSCKVQIGNDLVVELPITFEKLMSMGVTVPDDVDPENDIVDSGLQNSKNVTLNISGNLYSFIFYNNTDKNIKLKNCVCYHVYDKEIRDNYTAPFVMPGGIKVGSTRDEVKAVYGDVCEESSKNITANIVNEISKKRTSFTLEIDSSTKTVSNITYHVYDNE